MAPPAVGIEVPADELRQCTQHLLGYWTHKWFGEYQAAVAENAVQLLRETAAGRPLPLFDLDSLDLPRTSYLLGSYYYILASHKKANFYLKRVNQKRRVLFLRGFDDYRVFGGSGVGVGMTEPASMPFTWRLGEALDGAAETFAALSPLDFYWGTASAQIHFNGDYENIIPLTSHPIRNFYVNATSWQSDIEALVDRMDYFVVYAPAITEGLAWEVELLARKGRAAQTTVVVDEPAMAVRRHRSQLAEAMESDRFTPTLWRSRSQNAEPPAIHRFRRVLTEFTVLTPEEFFGDLAGQKERIERARGPLGTGRREKPLVDFRFTPAVPDGVLARIRTFDAELDRSISGQLTKRAIASMPWFVLLLQLRILTTLLLGDHLATGEVLIVYGSALNSTRRALLADKNRGTLTEDAFSDMDELLAEHEEMTLSVGYSMRSFGQSHQYGDYRRSAGKMFERVSAETTTVADAFFATAADDRTDAPRWWMDRR
jgi:hypothetical protein